MKVTVYYESLCPDSIRFVTRQLYPTSKLLNFTTEFVPYGKAQVSGYFNFLGINFIFFFFLKHRTNPWAIRCQHGVNECLGNAVQACSLLGIKNNVDQVEFVNCVMSNSYPPLAGKAVSFFIHLFYYYVMYVCKRGAQSLVRETSRAFHGPISPIFLRKNKQKNSCKFFKNID